MCIRDRFLSMARSMLEGDETFQMTLFYGARDEAHIAYKTELDDLSSKGISVIYVLSEENKEG